MIIERVPVLRKLFLGVSQILEGLQVGSRVNIDSRPATRQLYQHEGAGIPDLFFTQYSLYAYFSI